MSTHSYPFILRTSKGWGVFFFAFLKGSPLYRHCSAPFFDHHGEQLGRVSMRGDKSGDSDSLPQAAARGRAVEIFRKPTIRTARESGTCLTNSVSREGP
jgi:hypothetical protein